MRAEIYICHFLHSYKPFCTRTLLYVQMPPVTPIQLPKSHTFFNKQLFLSKMMVIYSQLLISMLSTTQRQTSRLVYKHSNSEISNSTRAGSPQSISLSPLISNNLNDSWKRDIMPVCRSAHFSTQEGRKYCQFPLPSKQETSSYFKGILLQTLLRESKFLPLRLEEGLERNKAVIQMIKIQKQGNLKPQTLHLAVRMADRYLLNQSLKGTELAVLGCVCMWLASKIQDVVTPKFRFWVGCGQRFLQQELTTMQSRVLQYFCFDLNIPTPLTLFNLLIPQIKLQERTYYLCLYLMELSLLDNRFLQYLPSVITLSAVYIALQTTDPLKWSQQRFCQVLEVGSQQLKDCSTLLVNLMISASKMQNNEVVQKYSSDYCFRVSKIIFRKTIR